MLLNFGQSQVKAEFKITNLIGNNMDSISANI